MFKRLWCKVFHKRTWGCLDSQCYEKGPMGLIQEVLDHCEKCDLCFSSVFWYSHAGAKVERLV